MEERKKGGLGKEVKGWLGILDGVVALGLMRLIINYTRAKLDKCKATPFFSSNECCGYPNPIADCEEYCDKYLCCAYSGRAKRKRNKRKGCIGCSSAVFDKLDSSSVFESFLYWLGRCSEATNSSLRRTLGRLLGLTVIATVFPILPRLNPCRTEEDPVDKCFKVTVEAPLGCIEEMAGGCGAKPTEGEGYPLDDDEVPMSWRC